MRSASRATAFQWSVPISGARPWRPPPPAEPDSRRPFSSTMTEMLSRTIGRASARRVPSGRRISTSCIEAARLAETWTTRGSRPRSVGVDLAQHLDLHRELGVVERVAVGVEPLVGRLRRRGERAAAGADREARGLGGARQRGLGDLGRVGVAGGLAAHGAQAEALGGVVARVLQPAVVEDQRLPRAGARGRARRRRRRRWPRAARERGLGVEGGLEGAEAGGLLHGRPPDGGGRRGGALRHAASCSSPANMVDLARSYNTRARRRAGAARGGRG